MSDSGRGSGMDETHQRSKEQEREDRSQGSRQVNWWGIFGLLCGIGSAYLSLRILFRGDYSAGQRALISIGQILMTNLGPRFPHFASGNIEGLQAANTLC